jgi:WD40 repeat protein
VAVVSVSSRAVAGYFREHRLAVKALAWCSRHNNVMASAGLDRSIQLWKLAGGGGEGGPGPGTSRASGSLSGHSHGVMALAFSEASDALFSLDSRSVCLASILTAYPFSRNVLL